MKIKRVNKIQQQTQDTQSKRLDLNPNQRTLLSHIQQLPTDVIRLFLQEVYTHYPDLPLSINNFYDPMEMGTHLGISKPTIDLYTHLYLRVVKRTGETAIEYTQRKKDFNSEESPLQRTSSGYFRLVNPRILLFSIMAPARVTGKNTKLKQLRQTLTHKLGVQIGHPTVINSTEQTRQWTKES